jgi:hypothetical protein
MLEKLWLVNLTDQLGFAQDRRTEGKKNAEETSSIHHRRGSECGQILQKLRKTIKVAILSSSGKVSAATELAVSE